MPPDAVRAGVDRERSRNTRKVQHMETFCGPLEFMDELAAIEAEGNQVLLALARDSFSAKDLAAHTSLTPYRSEVLGDGAVLYRGRLGGRNSNLLVGFAGKKNRLMLPAPMFLQRMQAADWDVLIVRDESGQHFRLGTGQLASGFPELAAWIAGVASPYARVVTLGTSMGGLASVRFALMTPGVRAIALGARPVLDIARLFRPGRLPAAFDHVCACLPRGARDIVYVHSKDNAEDAKWSSALAAQSGGQVFAVPGETHGVLFGLWLTGQVQPFLTAALSEGPMSAVIERMNVAVGHQVS